MAAKKPALVGASATSGMLDFLRAVAGEEMFQAAMPILREKLALTPEKLAIMLKLVINPHESVNKGEEPVLRNIDRETLKKHKDNFLLPEFFGFRETRPLKP